MTEKQIRNVAHVLRQLEIMDQREATVLRMHFGLDTNKPRDLKEIGETLGLTRERVCEIEIEALNKLVEVNSGEIVAVRDAEPTQRVVPPEGAMWVENHFLPFQFDLHTPRGTVAAVWRTEFNPDIWLWHIPGTMCTRPCGTSDIAQQTAMETMAASGAWGFHCEEVKPECVRWRVDWTEGKEARTRTYRHIGNAQDRYHHSADKCVLFGMDKNLNWHELDRHEAEDK